MLDNDKIKRALVSVVIEKALLDVGKSAHGKVVEMLNSEYHCYLTDCYLHPEYLNDVLTKLFGNVGKTIVESITKQLNEFAYDKPLAKFLTVINRQTTTN